VKPADRPQVCWPRPTPDRTASGRASVPRAPGRYQQAPWQLFRVRLARRRSAVARATGRCPRLTAGRLSMGTDSPAPQGLWLDRRPRAILS
jgi:hypothetical protein